MVWLIRVGHMVVGIMGIGFSGMPLSQRIGAIEFDEEGFSLVDVTEIAPPTEPGRVRSLVLALRA